MIPKSLKDILKLNLSSDLRKEKEKIKMKKNLNKNLWIALLLVTILSLNMTLIARAIISSEPHAADAMWVEPSAVTFSTDSTSIGQKFNITAWLNITSADVYGYQVALLYNRTQLRGVRAGFTAGSTSEFMTGHQTQTSGPLIDTSYLGNGSVLTFESCKGSDYVPAPCEGSLMWIEFEILAAPGMGETLTSTFDISTNYPLRTWVQDYDLVKISITTYDSTYTFTSPTGPPTQYSLTVTHSSGGTTNLTGTHYYDSGTVVYVQAIPDSEYELEDWLLNGSSVGKTNPYAVLMGANYVLHAEFAVSLPPPEGTRIYVDPPEIIAPTMQPSSNFSINIAIDDVSDLKVCVFNLSYNTAVLNWLSISILRVQGQIPIATMMLDGEAGFMWIKLTYSTPITTDTPVPIVKIEFHLNALGCSPLDLHDTQFLDSEENPIAHQAFDGFFATQIRDVAIINVVPSRSWAYQGWEVNITVTAKNKGPHVNETFNVYAYYDSNLIGSFTVEDLPPGNETTITFIWNTTDAQPCHNYTISAQAETVPYELNITDNLYIDGNVKIRLLGDVTGDGVVDGSDMALVALAFASYPGHPNWNPDADLNRDNVVDGSDLVLVARNYGKSCAS